MENMKRFGKQAAWILVALAVVVTAVVVLCGPNAPVNDPQLTPNGDSVVVEGEGIEGEGNAAQLPEESPDETVEINQGGNADPGNLNALPIKQLLTWDAINAFPIKYADMPIAERRQLCVDFFNFSKTALWSPKEDLSYYGSSNDGNLVHVNTLEKGVVYGGLPYMTNSSGNVYRLMDFIDESTGVLDVHKYMTKEPDGSGIYENNAMKLFGGQCSYTSYWGWARVMNSAAYGITYSAVPTKGFIMDDRYPGYVKSISSWTTLDSGAHPEKYDTNNNRIVNTVNVCNDMGEQAMYQIYKEIQLGDGLVNVTSAGHFAMAAADAHVEYDANGNIDGANSYILVTDQASKWLENINDQGDWYLYEDGVCAKKTFEYLFTHSYVTFTFAEFQEGDILEETEVSFSHTGSTITKSQLFASTVSANYGIADVYVIVTDDAGKEVYRHIIRAEKPSIFDVSFSETTFEPVKGQSVSKVDTLGTLNPGTYHIEIEVQLGTGERPTVYTGTLKV